MITRKVQEMGKSLYITLPRHLCDLLGIGKGDNLSIEYNHNKIIIAQVAAAKPETRAASSPIGDAST